MLLIGSLHVLHMIIIWLTIDLKSQLCSASRQRHMNKLPRHLLINLPPVFTARCTCWLWLYSPSHQKILHVFVSHIGLSYYSHYTLTQRWHHIKDLMSRRCRRIMHCVYNAACACMYVCLHAPWIICQILLPSLPVLRFCCRGRRAGVLKTNQW